MYVPECALFSLATLTNFDSKKWNSFLAYVHCRHSNLPFYKMEKQGFLFLSWDHLKPVHSNVNLVLQWNYIWLMIMFNQTCVGHKCLVNLSTYTFCFCQALIYNLFCFKLQSWTGGQIRRWRKLSRPCSLKDREKWFLSCDHSLLLQNHVTSPFLLCQSIWILQLLNIHFSIDRHQSYNSNSDWQMLCACAGFPGQRKR
jgi:hypothetical protein